MDQKQHADLTTQQHMQAECRRRYIGFLRAATSEAFGLTAHKSSNAFYYIQLSASVAEDRIYDSDGLFEGTVCPQLRLLFALY